MLSRALSIATVTLLIGCFTAGAARAQNLDAGKSPSQIFSNTCTACHKSPRGLLKTTPASSLPGFLRQHYTTGTEMASVLSSYLISNGAADPRYQSKDPSKRDARRDAETRPPRSKAGAARTARPSSAGRRANCPGCRRGAAARRGRASRPPREAVRASARGAVRRWTGPGTSRHRQQAARSSEAGPARQARGRARRAAENRAGHPRRYREGRQHVARCLQVRIRRNGFHQARNAEAGF